MNNSCNRPPLMYMYGNYGINHEGVTLCATVYSDCVVVLYDFSEPSICGEMPSTCPCDQMIKHTCMISYMKSEIISNHF